jgi:autotransporter-associated beta strand protein
VREFICKSWDGFTGKLLARGMSTSSDGSQLMLYNGIGIPNAVVDLRGNTRVICWKAASTYYLGGLSGALGTYLSGASKNTNSTTMTWIVGGANTDETFYGVIDNRCSANGYNCTTHIQKAGTGDWRLMGTSVYSGSTTVNGGRLVVNGSLTGNGAISVNNEATLCGKGSVKGKVTVNDGGKVAVGDTLFNKSDVFTLNGGLNLLNGGIIEVPLNRKQILNNAAKIKFAANSTLNGTLKLDMTDVTIDIPNNSSFAIFSIASGVTLSGSISAVEPAQPSETQEWDLSELFTTGRIYIREKGYTALPKVNVVPVSEQYFSLDGVSLGMEPPHTGSLALFIVKKKYQDGSVRFEKVMVY